MKLVQKTLLLSVAVLGLAGCSSSQDNLSWPNISEEYAKNHKIGTWVEVDRVKLVQPGLTRNKVFELIGNPLFSDNPYSDTEWDYVFNFAGANNTQTVCQYKVKFNSSNLVENTYWKPEGCLANISKPAEASVTASQVDSNIQILFAFDSSKVSAEEKQSISNLAAQIKANNIQKVTLVGYSDRLGNQEYNIRLSKRRANQVKKLLIAEGVNVEIVTVGKGDASQVVSCDDKRGAELQECLRPNRRVEVVFN